MNITLIGIGNIGSTLAINFSQKEKVTLYIRNKDEVNLYQKNMKLHDCDKNEVIEGKIDRIVTSLEEALKDADYVFITYPAFLLPALAKEMNKYTNKNNHLVFVPGSGGCEFFFQESILKGCPITGLQRVHAVARLKEKGKLVEQKGKRNEMKISTIPFSKAEQTRKDFEYLFEIPFINIGNYLNITLTNSNPILHTSRLYSLFQGYKQGNFYSRIPLFYEEWDLNSSRLLINMDNELFKIIDKLNKYNLEVNQITRLLDHYESVDEESLTNKINSITGFKGLTTPSIKEEKGYLPDFSSRYFINDFDYGLEIIYQFGLILNIKMKYIPQVLNWYYAITNRKSEFKLSDFGINNKEQLIEYYQKCNI